MNRTMINGGALLLVLVLAVPAHGQASISPYAGAMIYDGSLMIAEGEARRNAGIDRDPPTAVLGVRLGYELPSRAELEVSYGRSWLQNHSDDLASHLYQAVIRYPVLDAEAWAVYLAAGGGGITYRSEAAELGSLSDPAVSGGIGLSYALSPAWDLRTDLAFMGQFCDEPDTKQGLVCNRGSQLGYTQLSAGVRARLGGRP